jgi:hypothetical protein
VLLAYRVMKGKKGTAEAVTKPWAHLLNKTRNEVLHFRNLEPYKNKNKNKNKGKKRKRQGRDCCASSQGRIAQDPADAA